MRYLTFIAAVMMCFSACTSAPQNSNDNKKPGSGSGQVQPSQTPQGGTNPQGGIPTGSQAALTDVVIVNAIGGENNNQAQLLSSNLASLLSALGQKASANNNLHVALIASPVGSISGVSATLNVPGGQQINFELAPKDSLLGTIVAGCDANSSSLDSTHSAGSITVCGTSVSIPAHAWSWGVEDLKGKLVSFFRPQAARIYIIIASNDPTIVTGQQFLSMASSQTKGGSVRVYTIVPASSSGGICNTQNKTATVLADASRAANGQTYSYCQADWSSYIANIMQSI